MENAHEQPAGEAITRVFHVQGTVRAEELGEMLALMPIGVLVLEGDAGRVIMANQVAIDLSGRDVVGSVAEERRAWLKRVDGATWAIEELPGARALRGERVEAQEVVVLRPDGRARRVEVYAIPLQASAEASRRVLLTMLDVTRRKRAEDHVVAKLTELETALAALPDVYFRLDAGGTILDARSGQSARWTVEPLIGKRLEQAFDASALPRIERAVREVYATQSLATVEYEHDTSDGARWHEVRILPTSRGELILIVRDTTELQRARERLMRSLEEKDVLLKEIHHRVKNNLQMISSLLRLQSQQSRTPEARAMFQDSQSRIKTMALIHDQLYQSDDVARIDFGAHLRDLAAMLVAVYGREDCAVSTKLDVEPVILDLDTAIPLGLVANELVTNVLKHAFSGRARGTIYVSLAHVDSALSLTVADDGVGFPADAEPELSGSLGLRMTRLLCEHLHAQITLDRRRNAVTVLVPVRP